MKSIMKMTARIMIITIIAVFCIGAVPQTAFADPNPEILDWSGDRYLYPGQTDVKLHIYTSMAVESVDLYYNDNGSWRKWKSCTAADGDMDYWTVTVRQDTAPKPRMEFRYHMFYSGGSAVTISPSFIVEWTTYRGWERVFGANRFKTAVAIADKLLAVDEISKFKYAIIACGTNYADALSGSYASAVCTSNTDSPTPIYLVSNNEKVIQETADEIKAKFDGTGFIFILGGTGAVPKEMETALQNRGIYSYHRLAGKDRYDTNMKILEYFSQWDYDHLNDQIMLCSGKNFADALSASAIKHPIMLVGDELTLDQEAYFMENDPYIYLIGGTGAVSQAIEDEIYHDFGFLYWRLGGTDRFETSRIVAEYFFPHQPFNAVLAYSMNFPDGLAGGPLAQRLNAPLLLVRDNNYQAAERFFYEHDPRYAVVLGGPSLISDTTAKRILERWEYAAG